MSVLDKISDNSRIKLLMHLIRKKDSIPSYRKNKKMEKELVFLGVECSKYGTSKKANYETPMNCIKPVVYYEISKVINSPNTKDSLLHIQMGTAGNYEGVIYLNTHLKKYYTVNFLSEYDKMLKHLADTLFIKSQIKFIFPYLDLKINFEETSDEEDDY